ncbi:glycosyltransferase family 2 protein [Acinetobacter sp. WZC-1]|uniref:glycosyltransferase family 2 protein n=1 Tax=Acinetobacter sp. WZC-1 TaxID=3459034 RepID=UPI00403E0F8F
MYNNKLAVIVSYNPEIENLAHLIDQLLLQKCDVVLVDNGSKNTIVFERFKSLDNLEIILLNENFGIALAQNFGIGRAIDLKYEYSIVFDQDSSIDVNFISNMISAYEKISILDHKVATIGPTFIDTKTNKKSYAIRYDGLRLKKIYSNNTKDAISSDYIISSGSLFKTIIFKEIGMMDEKLFIDFVDIEWGMRAKQLGYTSYMSTEVFMNHTIGNLSKRIPLTDRYINIHSDFRKYFIVRNAIYLMLYSDLPLNWKIIQFFKTNFYMVTILMASTNKLKIINKYFLAVRDGLKKKMYKGSM